MNEVKFVKAEKPPGYPTEYSVSCDGQHIGNLWYMWDPDRGEPRSGWLILLTEWPTISSPTLEDAKYYVRENIVRIMASIRRLLG